MVRVRGNAGVFVFLLFCVVWNGYLALTQEWLDRRVFCFCVFGAAFFLFRVLVFCVVAYYGKVRFLGDHFQRRRPSTGFVAWLIFRKGRRM